MCQDYEGCNYWTFDASYIHTDDKRCWIKSSGTGPNTLINNQSGPKYGCVIPTKKRQNAATNARTTTTITRRYLVATGCFDDSLCNTGNPGKTEIVDIFDPSKSCILEDIPDRFESIGGLLGATPVICGGRYASGSGNIYDECLLYGTQQVITMNNKNYQMASVGLNSSLIWNLGGYLGGSYVLDTTEFITINGAVNGPTLPEALFWSCAVKFPDNGWIYLTGGHTANGVTKNVWMSNPSDGFSSFTQGPSFIETRYQHGCGTMSVGAKSIIVAAGGCCSGNSDYKYNVEILDPQSNTNQWVAGK